MMISKKEHMIKKKYQSLLSFQTIVLGYQTKNTIYEKTAKLNP